MANRNVIPELTSASGKLNGRSAILGTEAIIPRNRELHHMIQGDTLKVFLFITTIDCFMGILRPSAKDMANYL